MATQFSSTLLPDNSTDAHFQAWAMFFESTLVTTGGWTLSTEVGDTPPATLVHPTLANTKKGFRVYKMSDGLSAMAMRVDYGSSGSANTPGIWTTIGTGSDGSGNITGILWNGGTSGTPNIGSNTFTTTGTFNSYGSAASNRLSIALFVQTNAAYHMVLTIERSKNSGGGDTTDGLLLTYRDGTLSGTGMQQCRYIVNAGGTQPSLEQGFNYILTRISPSETFGGDIGVGVVSHFKGPAQQPGINMLITNSNDVSAEATIPITIYSVSRTYVQLNALAPFKALVGTNTLDTNARILMRYD